MACRPPAATGNSNLRYHFEDCALDTDARELCRGTSAVPVEPQVFDLLVYLIRNRDRVVSKDDLIASIWHGRIVSESTLNTRISAARFVIGDNGKDQRIIKTWPRKGIRFVGIVREEQRSPDGKAAIPASARVQNEAIPPKSRLDTLAHRVPEHAHERDSGDVLMDERKHITVLRADLKRTLEVLGQHDPEEALKIFEAVLTLMTQAVHRYEGTVNRVTGDGIVALFGVPLAHEDHAVRACYAALELQRAAKQYGEGEERLSGVPILLRAGLSSGEVVIRSIRGGSHTECRVMGQATELAHRLAEMAAPGTLLVSAETLRLVEGHIQARVPELANITGLGERAYELIAPGPAQTRFQALAARGLTSFVGRSVEMEQLERVWARTQERHGRVVAIIGEPGLGKSRLLHEYFRSHRTWGWLVLETASVSYRKAASYQPVIDLLRTYFKLEVSDDVHEVRNKVAGRLLDLDRALEPDLPALLALLDAPVEEPSWQALNSFQRRQRTLDALKHLVLRESQQQPVILVFEDLHWVDSETQAFLETLIDGLASAPLLLVLTYRPEYEHHWGGKSYYTQLRLDVLSPDTTEEFLRNLMGDDVSLIRLKELLPKQGNPLFLEESIRSLVETNLLEGTRGAYRLVRPLHELRIPPTVQAVLAARIDRLSRRDKRLLQAASVVGNNVPHAILQAIAGLGEEELRCGLAKLREAEFLYEVRLFPELEYSFKHAVTYDVTYGGVLKERRRELHARIVDVIETLHQDRVGADVEQLAHHAVQGELREKAVHYLRQSGLKAAQRSALPDARAYFEQTLGVVEALQESPSLLEQAFEVRLELRPMLVQLGEIQQVLDRLREAGILADRLNDDRRRGLVCAFMANIHSLRGELDEALASGAHALEIASRLEDLSLRVLATSYLVQAYYFRGEYKHAAELAINNLVALRGERVHEHFGLPAPASVWDRCFLVLSLAQLGRFTEAAQHEVEVIRLAEPMQHAFSIGWAYFAAGTRHLVEGDWARARPLLDHSIAVTRTGNIVFHLPWRVASSAWVLAQLGDGSEALNRLQEGEQLLQRQPARAIASYLGWTYHSMGRAYLLLGRLDEAWRLGNQAIESFPRQFGLVAHGLQLLGDIATHPDRSGDERGKAYYRKALLLAEPRGMSPLVAHCHLGLGKVYRRAAKNREARKHLMTAASIYRETRMRFWLDRTEAEINVSQ
jgi:class 3 adenylate cyclase/tetratricopeptide (TPR) repeat protein